MKKRTMSESSSARVNNNSDSKKHYSTEVQYSNKFDDPSPMIDKVVYNSYDKVSANIASSVPKCYKNRTGFT